MTAIDPRSAWATLGRPLRLGVIGGGPGSFIGPIHRTAAVLDQRFVIVAGVLSSDPLRAVSYGAALGLDASRAYVSVAQMIAAESTRAAEDRIEAVAVMTPNDRHYTDCVLALQAGLHVICDKPMVNTLRQARHLVELVEQTQLAFCLTHNYSGYPMVRQARAMVEAGVLGDIRIVQAEYLQGGMALPVESGVLNDKKRLLAASTAATGILFLRIGLFLAHHSCHRM